MDLPTGANATVLYCTPHSTVSYCSTVVLYSRDQPDHATIEISNSNADPAPHHLGERSRAVDNIEMSNSLLERGKTSLLMTLTLTYHIGKPLSINGFPPILGCIGTNQRDLWLI